SRLLKLDGEFHVSHKRAPGPYAARGATALKAGNRETRVADRSAQFPHLAEYDRLVRRRIAIMAVLAIGAVLAFLADIAIGPSSLTATEAVRGVLFPSELSGPRQIIVWDVRLPQAVMALLVGAALSLAGAEMQTILNNPLASPFTLGVSSAASLGAALAIVLGIGWPGIGITWLISANAFIFAFGSVLLLQALSRLRGTSPETLVLFGIAMVFTFNALVAVIQFIASQEALQQLVFWSMGSLSRASWDKIAILALIIVLVGPFSLSASWPMTALRL